jgi:hypothetical protein
MIVKINGKDVKVAVSDGGVFYDEETKTISATTLKGLIKKLREEAIPKAGIPVIRSSDKRKGVVPGRAAKTGYRKRYFVVNWEGGGRDETSGHELVRQATPLEEESISKATKEANDKELAYNRAYQEMNQARTKLELAKRVISMYDILSNAFPYN